MAHAEKTWIDDDDDSDSDPEIQFTSPPPKVTSGRPAARDRRRIPVPQEKASEPPSRVRDRRAVSKADEASAEPMSPRQTRAATGRKRSIPDQTDSDGSGSSDTDDMTSRDPGNLEERDRKGKERDEPVSDTQQGDVDGDGRLDETSEKSADEDDEEQEEDKNARRPSKRRRMAQGDPAWDEVARKALPRDRWDDDALDIMISWTDRNTSPGNVLEAVHMLVEMAREHDAKNSQWTELALPTCRRTLESLSTRTRLGPEFLTEATAAFANRHCLFCRGTLPPFHAGFQSPHLCVCCDRCAGKRLTRQYIVRKSYPLMTKAQIKHARTLGRIIGNKIITLYFIEDIEAIAQENGQAPVVSIPQLMDNASDVTGAKPRSRAQTAGPRARASSSGSQIQDAIEDEPSPVAAEDLRAAVRAFKAMGMHERVSATEKMALVPEKRRGKEAEAAASIGRRFAELERAILPERQFNMGLLLLLSLLKSSTRRCASELTKVRQFVLGRPTETETDGECAGCLEGLRSMLSGIDQNLMKFHLMTKNADASAISEPFACALLNPEYLSQLSQRAGTFWVSGDLGDVASQLAVN